MDTLQTVLEAELPLELWEAASKQAHRSGLGHFKTGAIVFDKNYKIVGRGCSHYAVHSTLPTVHAEEHALKDSYGARNYGDYKKGQPFSIVIVCLNKSGNFSHSSRPCVSCATRLNTSGVKFVYYAERQNSGEWIVNIESPRELVYRTVSNKSNSQYAKDMRIK